MKKTIVLPGEPICMIEEFLPGKGVSVDPNGIVKSLYFGKVYYDLNKREVSVVLFGEKNVLEEKDIVLAEIKDVQDKIAVAEAFAKFPDKPLKYRRTGVILAKKNDQMDELVVEGDVVIVEVSSIYRGIVTFDIYKPGCGVFLAICSACGRVLEKKERLLVCKNCGNKERRRTVLKYGNLELLKELVTVAW